MRQRYTRKPRVEVDPVESWVALLWIRGYPPVSLFFGLTSCSCGERTGLHLCRCSAAANPPVYLGRIHFDVSVPRDTALSGAYTYTVADYLSLVARPAGSTRNGNQLSIVGPECHPRMTWRSLPATRSSRSPRHQRYRQHQPSGDYPVTSTRICMQIARCAIQYARLRRTCRSLSYFPFVPRRCLLYITSSVYTVSHTEIPHVGQRVATISRSIARTRCN